MLVAGACAYGLQLTAVAIVPRADAADQHEVTSATGTRQVSIVAIDPVTGDHTQVECDAPANSFASDIVLVDARAFRAIASACNRTDVAEAGP